MARDVIVIGAGGGGAVVAKELAARGLDVLVLEAGRYDRDQDAAWTHFENDANNILTGYFRWGPPDRSRPAWLRETPQNSLMWQLAGVGGTTQHYYGNSPRAMPGVFAGYGGADAAAYDRDHAFPFTYEELVPYYEWVEETLPVQTAAMGSKESLFFRGAEGLGLPVNTTKDVTRDSFRPQENAILQPGGNAGRTTDPAALVFPQATGCTSCGYCFQGCYEPRRAPRNLKAKRSTDTSYVPMALTADRWAGGTAAELTTGAFVTRIHTAEEGGETVARAVTWRASDTGEEVTEEAHVIVMSGGCTENPRLWLNSGLPDPNGWVGRGYTDHFFDWVIGVFPFETGSWKGVGSSARVDFPGRGGLENVGLPPALQAFSNGFSDMGVAGHYTNGWDVDSGADTTGRLVGTAFSEYMASFRNVLNVLVITDDDVEPDNRVLLSDSYPPDEHGAVPKVEFPFRQRSARTLDNRAFLTRQAVDLLRAAGATSVHHIGWPPLILHVQSTMRMGTSEVDSVSLPSGEARWVKRLFIGDNSVLANALGGPNPTLTSQAVATRTAEQLYRRYFDGDPWVGSETPVSSIDDAVTQAVLDTGLSDGADGGVAGGGGAGGGADGRGATPATGAGGMALGAAAMGAAALLRRRSRADRSCDRSCDHDHGKGAG